MLRVFNWLDESARRSPLSIELSVANSRAILETSSAAGPAPNGQGRYFLTTYYRVVSFFAIYQGQQPLRGTIALSLLFKSI